MYPCKLQKSDLFNTAQGILMMLLLKKFTHYVGLFLIKLILQTTINNPTCGPNPVPFNQGRSKANLHSGPSTKMAPIPKIK